MGWGDGGGKGERTLGKWGGAGCGERGEGREKGHWENGVGLGVGMGGMGGGSRLAEERVVGPLGEVYAARDGGGLHAAGGVDRVAKEAPPAWIEITYGTRRRCFGVDSGPRLNRFKLSWSLKRHRLHAGLKGGRGGGRGGRDRGEWDGPLFPFSAGIGRSRYLHSGSKLDRPLNVVCSSHSD